MSRYNVTYIPRSKIYQLLMQTSNYNLLNHTSFNSKTLNCTIAIDLTYRQFSLQSTLRKCYSRHNTFPGRYWYKDDEYLATYGHGREAVRRANTRSEQTCLCWQEVACIARVLPLSIPAASLILYNAYWRKTDNISSQTSLATSFSQIWSLSFWINGIYWKRRRLYFDYIGFVAVDSDCHIPLEIDVLFMRNIYLSLISILIFKSWCWE